MCRSRLCGWEWGQCRAAGECCLHGLCVCGMGSVVLLLGVTRLRLQECGADCAKFQKSELEYKFNKKALERPYASKHSWGKTYGEHKRHLEFSHDQYRELKKYAEEVGIFFTASGMDEVNTTHQHDARFSCCICCAIKLLQ